MLEKVSVIVLTIFLCVTVLEIGLRIIGKSPSNTISGIAEQNGNSYRLIKNAKKDINWPAYSYTVYTNSFGFRDKSIGERDITNNSYSFIISIFYFIANISMNYYTKLNIS